MSDTRKQIGLRREDKSVWERRVPLIPRHVAALINEHDLAIKVQPAENRIIPLDEYLAVGASADEDLSACSVIFGVKEIPPDLIQPGKTYVFFSHTVKGQPYNMSMLRRLIEQKCQLIDYERIIDEQGRRLIFFGRHAGWAGMTDTLWSLGQRLQVEGMPNPFTTMQPAHRYDSIERIKDVVGKIGAEITRNGIPEAINPLIIGFTGYGNVSQGAQDIIEPLPLVELTPQDLAGRGAAAFADPYKVYKVIFKEEDLVVPSGADDEFVLNDYYQHPEKYVSCFDNYTPHLSVLVNCIYWDTQYPRLVTKAFLRQHFAAGATPRLKVIGDITCDVEGSVEATVKATLPDNPVYVYDPLNDRAIDGFVGSGPVIMAVDILPSELPLVASRDFSKVLKQFVPEIAAADYQGRFVDCQLSLPIKKAMILYQGELTPDYQFMKEFI